MSSSSAPQSETKPSNDSAVPVAVIGVGRMGRHHARLYHELPQADLVAIVDHDLERATELAEQYHCRAFSDISDLLASDLPLTAASVAVPTIYHEPIAAQLLARRIACLIEKPLAPSMAVAHQIVQTAQQNETLVQVGHTERFNPAVRAISQIKQTPRFMEVDRVSPMTFRSIDVGVVFDLMIHDLDIILMLAQSPVVDVRAVGLSVIGQHEDVANARIEFANGCVANLTASRLAMKTERKLRIFSESAYLSVDYARKSGIMINQTDNQTSLNEMRQQIAAGKDLSDLDYTDLIQVQDLSIEDEEPLKAELLNFLSAAIGEATPAVDAEAGSAAVAVAEQVVESIRSHQWEGVDLKTDGPTAFI